MEKRIIELIDSIIRVNHAGEMGANSIYCAQVKNVKNNDECEILRKNLSEELHHLDYFEKIGKEFQIRPTIMHPLWKKAAYALGFVAGKMGFEACMACTDGVESVIQKHYEEQLREIDDILLDLNEDSKYFTILNNLKTYINIFLSDEIRHKDHSEGNYRNSLKNRIIKKASSFASDMAIKISKKW